MSDVARPKFISVELSNRRMLYQSFMPFLKNGGVFVPTSKEFVLGETVFLLLRLFDVSESFAIETTVAWITPGNARGSFEAGVGLQFSVHGPGRAAYDLILKLLGDSLQSSKRTSTL